ncbi:MAG: lysophospholipid acyltransferase family protein [Parvularculaceae bacterium]
MRTVLRAIGRAMFEAVRALGLFVYRLAGWRIVGERPDEKKFVAIVAPHTSNWDLPLLLCVAFYFRLRVCWMGKAALFKPPFGWLFTALGGVPVDRRKAHNVVAQMVDLFNQRDHFALGLSPEGTRARVEEWKTGFYNIAKGAGVPIVLGFIDYARKVAGVGMILRPSGDYEADLRVIKDFYAGCTGKFPERGVASR